MKNKRILIAIFVIVISIIAALTVYTIFKPDASENSEPNSSMQSEDQPQKQPDSQEQSEKEDESNNKNDGSDAVDKPQPTKPENSDGRIIVSNPDDITVMLNKSHALPDSWAPNDLKAINANAGGTHYLRAEAAEAWEKIRLDSKNDGITINVVSSYRSKQFQYDLYNYYMSFDAANAPNYSAYPRTSEHEMGLAIDVSYDGSLHNDLQNSDVGGWMNDHGWKYGWIMRYPKGKEHITGYIFEPWHYRYVGKELAAKLHNSGLTMEEYYKEH